MTIKSYENYSGIITSLFDVSYSKNDINNLMKKLNEVPIAEIEIELDSIGLIKNSGLHENILATAMINYPLGGYTAEYIVDSIKWACENKADVICTNLPLFWLRSNEKKRISNLVREIIKACGKKTIRISLDSDLLSKEEILSVCDLLCDAGIDQLKSSCGFNHNSSADVISFIREEYPDIILTVDNNLKGNSNEIDSLFGQGVRYVCAKEPWLYHF